MPLFESIMGEPVIDLSLNDLDDGYESENESENDEHDENECCTEEELTSDAINTFINHYKYMCILLLNLFYKLSLNIALFFGTTMYYLKIFSNKLYESDANIAYVMDFTLYLKRYCYGLIKNVKTEPFSNNWTSISYIDYLKYTHEEYNYTTYANPKYNELIISLHDNWANLNSVNTINNIYMFEYSKNNIKEKTEGPLFISKYNDLGASRYYVSYEIPKKLDFNERIPSNVRFLSIAYTHPNMKNQIIFELHKSWFVVGNQLLSSEFVFRQLVYQYEPFVFDNRYKIVLLNSNVEETQLTNNEYIEILENEYKVHTISE